MKALVLKSVKAPLELEERPPLQPGPGEVVVRLRAAALNRRDYWITQGLYPGIEPPVILGSDGAGKVSQVGAGVGPSWEGRDVIINPGLGWGEQFSSVTFNVILTAVVFTFALSFLGVWEIPIPGFVGSGKAVELADKEGPAGAFSKGVLTTVLATPCSGPMLVPALNWAVSQPPLIAYTGFACVGLGMASPYLLIGTFPKLIAFLPKPGAWMDTFKHIMGFVLLGTVVFLLTFLSIPYVVPTFAFLIGLWAALWWIDRTPLTETIHKRIKAWAEASLFAAFIGIIAFVWIGIPGILSVRDGLHGIMESRFQRAVDRELARRNVPVNLSAADSKQTDDELPWQPFSLQLLQKLTAEQKTVFVDFTADW
ncbi:MAG: alcohol dehydrogenase catalytic domain-containing protein [Planctomycetes bacterium]|nr:alcohol dehydrogenase catalytic domain-containing protein [Planctomycetota bacterium]